MNATSTASSVTVTNSTTSTIPAQTVLLPFPKHGVKLSYMAEFIDDACGGRDELVGLTTTEVCEKFVKPHTDLAQSSYCDLLAAMSHPAVGIATAFVSHAWRYKFLDVVDALLTHFADALDTVLWFDLFSNNQHKPTELEFDWWCSTFKSAVEQFGHTVMIFAPWNDPIPLTRSWCIWELYCTLATESRFQIALSAADKEQFLSDVIQSPMAVVNKMLATIDARKSECWKKEDQERIHEVIQREVGFSQINDMVFALMRDWVLTTVQEEIASTTSSEEDKIKLLMVLATLHADQGKYAEAEPLYLECLERWKEIFGATHPDSFESMNSLANLYLEQGKDTEAEPMLVECLAKRKEILGATNPDTLMSMNNLANLYVGQGKYAEAEALYLECLNKRKETLGATHPDTLGSMNNLAAFYHDQGECAEAESLYVDCIAKRKEILGATHPDTIRLMNNLAMLQMDQGKYTEAEVLYMECREMLKESLGATHPDTLSSINTLAIFYQNQGKNAEAEALFIECFTKRKEILGATHPNTLIPMNNLAFIYQNQGKYAEAETLYLECIAKRKETLGATHPATLTSIKNLAKLYRQQGKYAEAEAL